MPIHTIKRTNMQPFLSGKKLLGDDATPAELDAWFAEETNGYADLVEDDVIIQKNDEISAALNRRHIRNHLAGKTGLTGLVFGPANATELQSIDSHFAQWHAIEPGKVFHKPEFYSKPVTFLPVTAGGKIDLPDNSVDVVLCMSVLHHIANVGFVMAEIARVLKPNGLVFLREPTVTMGEWGTARPGLTPNERGLPLGWLLNTCAKNNLKVIQALPSVFPPLDRLVRKLGMQKPYASNAYIAADSLFSTLTAPFARYHRTSWYQRFAPAAVLLVARKQA